MKKYNVFVTLLIIGLFILLPFNAKAERNIGNNRSPFPDINERMYAAFSGDGYLGLSKSHYYVKWLQDSGGHYAPWIVYCYEFNTPFRDKDKTQGMNYSYRGVADVGVQYIIKNGFTGTGESYHYSAYSNCEANFCTSLRGKVTNSPKFGQPWYVNYWLTQVAIWIYQGAVPNFTGNLSGNKKIIQDLVNGAREVKKSSTNFAKIDPKMNVGDSNLKLSGDYYYSDIISATGVGEKFTVSVNNSNYEIVDTNKKAKTQFNSGAKFYIRIAKNKVNKEEEVTVTLSTTAKTYAVRYSDTGTQDLVFYKEKNEETKKTTLKLNVSYACDLIVKVVDNVTGEKVCGGTVTVLDENGNVAKNTKGEELKSVAISADKCEASISLPWGKYRVVQETAKDPYVKDSNEYSVIAETECPLNVTLKNEKLYQIRILKISGSEENIITGAKLKLEDSNGNIIKEFVSSTEPQLIEKLHAGTYYLSEVQAPKGYYLSSEKVAIEVNKENNNKQFVFNNDEIIVPKTDFDSKLLGISLFLGLIGVALVYYARKKLV